MEQIYSNGKYLSNNPQWHSEDSPWKANQIIKMLTKNKLNVGSICEIGCGIGGVLNSLHSKMDSDKKFTGYEISKEAFEISQKLEKERLNFIYDDLANSDTASHFDLLLSIDVFEHVEDYLNFLKKIKNKSTYKIFHIPLDLSVQTVLRVSPIIEARKKVGHIHYFNKEIALEALKDTGYEILDYFYTPSSNETPNRTFKRNLMRLPRKFFFSVNEDLCVRLFGGYSMLVLAK